MAKIDPEKDGKYKLRGPKDADLEGIDEKKYDVFTETEKLGNAQRDFPSYNWFVSFTIKDKNGNSMGAMPEYTIKFDKPNDSDNFELYYYLDGSVFSVPHQSENRKRAKAKLTIGDPPTGTIP